MHRRKQKLKIRISVTWMWNSIYSTTSDFQEIYFFAKNVFLATFWEKVYQEVQTLLQSKTNTLRFFTARA